jgi:hypothetical protein
MRLMKTLYLFIFSLSLGAVLPAFAQPEVNRVSCYEGFDYYGSVQGNFNTDSVDKFEENYITGPKPPKPVGPPINQPSAGPISPANKFVKRYANLPLIAGKDITLHNINFNNLSTNSPYSLGWAGDWTTSDGIRLYGATANTGYYVGQENSFTISSNNDTWSLINTGFFLRGGVGKSPSVTVGRRIQTSTAGFFYDYKIRDKTQIDRDPTNNTPLSVKPGNIPVVGSTGKNGPIETLSSSPIRALLDIPLANNGSVAGNQKGTTNFPGVNNFRDPVDHPYSTLNTCIGAQGTTAWFGLLMRKDGDFVDQAFVTLHKNGSVWDNSQTPATPNISVGYFGGTPNWGVRVGDTINLSSSSIVLGQFTLLVLGVTFDYVGNHRINFYIIPDNSPKLNIYPILPTPDLSFTVPGSNDLAFHSLAYFGGDSPNKSAIDEVRFGRDYQRAALCSDRISVVRGLCRGLSGLSIYSDGDFGTTPLRVAQDYDPAPAGDIKGSVSPWDDAVPTKVIIKNKTATLPISGVQYQNIAPLYQYQANQSGQPNDGSFVVANQVRDPFGPWIKAYDNSTSDINGMMMIVNATYSSSAFFQQTIPGVCGGIQYEFYTDILNVFSKDKESITIPGTYTSPFVSYGGTTCDTIKEPGCQQFSAAGRDQADAVSVGGATSNLCGTPGTPASPGDCRTASISPQLEFLLGNPSDPASKDVIAYTPPISVTNDEKWHRIGFTFVTKSGVNSLRLTIRNAAPGGLGNDLALDNVTFRPCRPKAELSPPSIECGTTSIAVTVSEAGDGYDPPAVQWQIWRITDDLSTPGNITGQPDENEWKPAGPPVILGPADKGPGTKAPLNLLSLGGIATGSFVRAIVAGDGSSLAKPTCSVNSIPAKVNCVVPLPISLVYFRANAEQNRVKVSWQTAFETQADYFVVEHSTDGKNYTDKGRLPARGPEGKDARTNYVFWDEMPQPGINYYRLRQVDKNSLFEYFGPESVRVEGLPISVYPNPAQQEITVKFAEAFAQNTGFQIRISNALGKTVKNIQKVVTPGDQAFKTDVSDLSSGIYTLEVITSAFRYQYKIVLVH